MSVSLSQNGAGLDAMWGKEKALEMLGETGFIGVEVKTLSHDFQNYYYTATAPRKGVAKSSSQFNRGICMILTKSHIP
jgi:hypothetical protein